VCAWLCPLRTGGIAGAGLRNEDGEPRQGTARRQTEFAAEARTNVPLP
jgi:hypothetical protein